MRKPQNDKEVSRSRPVPSRDTFYLTVAALLLILIPVISTFLGPVANFLGPLLLFSIPTALFAVWKGLRTLSKPRYTLGQKAITAFFILVSLAILGFFAWLIIGIFFFPYGIVY